MSSRVKKTPGMLVKMTCDRFEIFWCDRICRQERLNSDNNLTLLDGDLTWIYCMDNLAHIFMD
jgi:hypothetical protein